MAETDKTKTLQSGLRQPVGSDKILNRGFWLGGTDVTQPSLDQYDLLRRGYGRLFILRLPKFIEKLLPETSAKFRHMLEFANVGIDGISGYSVEFGSVTAGYAGNTVEIPVNAKDDTNSITIKLYETTGSLIRTYIDFWITGVADPYTGLAHYHGAQTITNEKSLYYSQANHTMEALYVATDPSGNEIEYSCLLANMFPKQSNHDHFNYEPGSHDIVDMSLEFTATKYMSAQINDLGKAALNKYRILKNYLNFQDTDYDSANLGGAILMPGRDNNNHIWDKTRQVNGHYETDKVSNYPHWKD